MCCANLENIFRKICATWKSAIKNFGFALVFFCFFFSWFRTMSVLVANAHTISSSSVNTIWKEKKAYRFLSFCLCSVISHSLNLWTKINIFSDQISLETWYNLWVCVLYIPMLEWIFFSLYLCFNCHKIYF